VKPNWTPSARSDLAAIFNYLAPMSFNAAVDLEDRIQAAVGRLEAHAMLGRQGRLANSRELVVTGTRYLVIYRVAPDSIQILRIVHGAQDWPSALSPV
jgi:toxin ParE1/3/4